jgi:hypothetical protein
MGQGKRERVRTNGTGKGLGTMGQGKRERVRTNGTGKERKG